MNFGSIKSLLAFASCIVAAATFASPLSAQVIFVPIDTPTTGSDNVFVEQVGSGNEVGVDQASNGQTAEVRQDGADNFADVDQVGGGAHIALVDQAGDDNTVSLAQEGDGQTIAVLSQQGNANSALIFQRDNGVLGSAAEIVQNGSNNGLVLVQDGSDNQARLTQNGDVNVMTATQLNSGNRLEWLQDGTGLSDLQVTQTGGVTLQILQTNTGTVTTAGGSN